MSLTTLKEVHANSLVHEAFLLGLAFKDQTPGGLHDSFHRQYLPLIQGLNKAKDRDEELVKFVEIAYKRISSQLPRPTIK